MNTRPAVALLSLALAASPARAIVAIEPFSEQVSTTISSPFDSPTPDFQWDVSYERSFDGFSIVKHVEINFLFETPLGFTAQQKADWKAQTEAAVESIWNNKFAVRDTVNDRTYAVGVDITVDGPFDQTISVAQRPADCGSRPERLRLPRQHAQVVRRLDARDPRPRIRPHARPLRRVRRGRRRQAEQPHAVVRRDHGPRRPRSGSGLLRPLLPAVPRLHRRASRSPSTSASRGPASRRATSSSSPCRSRARGRCSVSVP
jgi:hypothetical protein